MSIVLLGSTSGSCTLQEQAVAGNTTLTLPTFNGTVGVLVSGTAVTASGTAIDFTGIPAGVRRITVVIADLSFAAAGNARLRLGTAGGLASSGYTGGVTTLSTGANTFTSLSDGSAALATGAAGSILNGQYVIVNVNGNIWQSNGFHYRNTDIVTNLNSTFITLSGTLDRLSLVATTSTFDAGSINILYE